MKTFEDQYKDKEPVNAIPEVLPPDYAEWLDTQKPTMPEHDAMANAMKTIIVKWVKSEEPFGYGKAMRVLESDHPRFTKGTRFDFGFMNVATEEGYTIISLPIDKAEPF